MRRKIMPKLTLEEKADKILEYFKFDSSKWPCQRDLHSNENGLLEIQDELQGIKIAQEDLDANHDSMNDHLVDVENKLDEIEEKINEILNIIKPSS